MSDEDRKRAEALLRIIRGWGPSKSIPKILAAFAEERRLERERLAARFDEHPNRTIYYPNVAATIRSAGPAEGLPPAESQGAPTAIRAEGTPLAAAPSAQPPLAEPSPPTPQASETPAEGALRAGLLEALKWIDPDSDPSPLTARELINKLSPLLARRPHGR